MNEKRATTPLRVKEKIIEKMYNKTRPLALALLLCFILAATAQAKPLQVMVSIPPQKWLVKKIGQELVQVDSLLNDSQNPHSYSPSPKQISRIFKADIYFLIGIEFEKQVVDRIVTNPHCPRIFDLSANIKKITATTSHDNHDPHTWLSPENLQFMAEEITSQLIILDKNNKQVYQKNLGLVKKEIEEADKTFQEKLAPLKERIFYVVHPSFAYFAHHYNLQQRAIESDGKMPSPRQMQEIAREIKEKNIQTIFIPGGQDDKIIDSICQISGAKGVPVNPLAENILQTMATVVDNISEKHE